MTLWSRLVQAFARTTQADEPNSRGVWIGRARSGVLVDNDSALKNAVVWACITYLSKTLAQLPWAVMKNVDGGSERMNAHPVDWLIHTRPCPDMGSFTWRQTMLGNALRFGNAYAEIEWDNRGMPFALWPIHPDRVIVKRGVDGLLAYEVWNRGGSVTLAARDVFHIRGFGDGPVGFNVIEYAAESIGWAQATEIFGASYFGQGMNPSGVIETPNGITPEGLSVLKAEMKKLYAGPKAERTMFLDKGMKFNKLANSPEESQFIETRQHQVEEICRWFGVPPHKVMHLLRAHFANIEHQSIEVVIDSIMPWVKVFQEEADYKLFGANRQGFFTKIDVRGLLQGDHESRGKFYVVLAGLGWSMNEIRALEDMNSIGPDGDLRFRSIQLQPLVDPVADATDDEPVTSRQLVEALRRLSVN